MPFALHQLLDDLARTAHLVRLDDEIDPRLEAAEIQRRVYARGGPAVLLANVKGCRFPMVSNLFGTIERARYLFRDTYDAVRRAIELKIEPAAALRNPLRYVSAPLRSPPGGCSRSWSARGRCWRGKRQPASSRSCSRGPWMADRLSRCRNAIPKT
jgi:3-polyprenyl-4-hydroxybenzoate decarboxylase